jgi:hypothetical protein
MWVEYEIPCSANANVLSLAEIGEKDKWFTHRAQEQLYDRCIVFDELLSDPYRCIAIEQRDKSVPCVGHHVGSYHPVTYPVLV